MVLNKENSNFDLVYCNDLTRYSRLETYSVTVGNIGIGGNNPIRVQSMTTTDTMNTIGTVEQSIRMIEAGCELVRITAPSLNEAKNLENIKEELRKRGYQTPLVADIHFTPNAAEMAARIVEKVRVNPGNYADKKKFETIDYSDSAYEAELERIRERFTPLVKICKEHGTAMRIGTNHGSLSDRILSRYGDTPLGMVESALEFLRICEDNNFYNVVLSMKASNTQVMVQAYRLLVNKMLNKSTQHIYPLHLGVTEAGEGEDGRIKSAVGIGSLLEDGLGDTIRVSLTEEPELEIPVARILVDRYNNRSESQKLQVSSYKFQVSYSPFEYCRSKTSEILNLGDNQVPRVIADFSHKEKIIPATFFSVGYNYSIPLDKWNITDLACDYIYLGTKKIDFEIPGTLGLIYDFNTWNILKNKTRCFPLFTSEEYFAIMKDPSTPLRMTSDTLNFIIIKTGEHISHLKSQISHPNKVVLVFEANSEHEMIDQRAMFIELKSMSEWESVPVIIKRNYSNTNEDEFQLHAATDFGALLIDGFGDGIWIQQNAISAHLVNSTAFGILQATRTRISKTEYISCPSCGRTLFDLQETTAKIRKRTDHLKGIKIGIMGCIVNGPGEMADADYGYVGTGVGKITLYKGKEVVAKNINSENAVDELINLIKKHGDWVEKVI